MKRKLVKPSFATDKQIDKLKDELSAEKRNVGNYKPNGFVEVIGNDLANQIKGENLVKSRTSGQSQFDLVSDLRKDISAKATTIAQLKESIDIKDAEINIYKEQQGILEADLIEAQNKRELFAKHLGETETELLHLKNTHSELLKSCSKIESENLELRKERNNVNNYALEIGSELNSIKQKWYYRWFS